MWMYFTVRNPSGDIDEFFPKIVVYSKLSCVVYVETFILIKNKTNLVLVMSSYLSTPFFSLSKKNMALSKSDPPNRT